MVVKDAPEFIKTLPIETIEPTAEIRLVLKKWGIYTLGEFLVLGKTALADRLGTESLYLFDRASANAPRPLRLANPPVVYEEATDFEDEVETAEALGVPMVVGNAVKQLLALTKAVQGPDTDITRIVCTVEKWAGAEVKGNRT